MIKFPNLLPEDSLEKDQIPGGLADKKKPSDFDPKQIKMGQKVEMEHTQDPEIAREISMDHLSENKKYYTDLKTIEPEHFKKSGKTIKLEHYSIQPNLMESGIDPSKHGTGVRGEESKRKSLSDWTDRSYHYLSGTKPEAALETMPHVYTSEVSEDKIYDYQKDPLNLKEKSKWGPSLDRNLYEKNIKDAGYHGYINYGAPGMGHVVALFHPVKPVSKRMKNKSLEKAGNPNKHAQEVLNAHKQGGSTYNLRTGHVSGDLYAVSPFLDRSEVVEGPLNEGHINNFINKNKDLLSKPNHNMGTWLDPETGKNYLDISITTPDKNKAIGLANKHNQKAIFHLGTFTTIPTGGTGEKMEKGSAQKRLKFNPANVNTKERQAVEGWTSNYPDYDRPQTPLEGNALARALHKLHSATKTRRNPETGEREFLLYRGKTGRDSVNGLNQLSSFTPHKRHAIDFNRDFVNSLDSDYAKTEIFDDTKHPHSIGSDISNPNRDKYIQDNLAHVYQAWVPESAIHHVPKQIGDTNLFSAVTAPKLTPRKAPFANEHEVIVDTSKVKDINAIPRHQIEAEHFKDLKLKHGGPQTRLEMKKLDKAYVDPHNARAAANLGIKDPKKHGHKYLGHYKVGRHKVEVYGIEEEPGLYDNHTFLVRDGAGHPVANLSTGYGMIFQGSSPDSDDYDYDIQTTHSFVKPEHRGKGIGRALYQAAINHHGELYSSSALSPHSDKMWHNMAKVPGIKFKSGGTDPNMEHFAQIKGPRKKLVKSVQVPGSSKDQFPKTYEALKFDGDVHNPAVMQHHMKLHEKHALAATSPESAKHHWDNVKKIQTHLNQGLNKSFPEVLRKANAILQKARKASPVGTITERTDGKYIKTQDGWEPYTQENANQAQSYINARQSSFVNVGEDIKGAARHKRAAYTPGDRATSENNKELINHYANTLVEEIGPHNPLNPFVLKQVIARFPKMKPGVDEGVYNNYLSHVTDFVEKNKSNPEIFTTLLNGLKRSLIDKINHDRKQPEYVRGSDSFIIKYVNNTINPYGVATGRVTKDLADFTTAAKTASATHTGTSTPNNDQLMGFFHTPEGTKFLKDAMGGKMKKPEAENGGRQRKLKYAPVDRYVKIAERKGPPVGLDTPQQQVDFLTKAGKIRGLQWGNSVTDPEREHHLKYTAEALKDLMDVTGMPLEMISFNGRLGLAFGARGKGRALAHYEPSEMTINLTRQNGVGSLSHEWGHFLDNVLAKTHNTSTSDEYMYLSEGSQYKMRREESPVAAAMTELINSDGWNEFSKSSRQHLLDLRKEGYGVDSKYWLTPKEMFARAFECHIDHKLKTMGRTNTYLTGVTRGGFWPSEEISAKMAPLFDKFFEELGKSDHLKKSIDLLNKSVLQKAIPAGMIFVRFDGDNAGSKVIQAEKTDDLNLAADISNRINAGGEAAKQKTLELGGQIILGGGDDLGILLPANQISAIDQIREAFRAASGFSMTAGYGTSIPQAIDALLWGKLRGKNQTVKWTPNISEYIGSLEHNQTQEDKIRNTLQKTIDVNYTNKKKHKFAGELDAT